MTKLQAEICVGIVLRKRSLSEEVSAQSALLGCAAKFSPRIESTFPGTVVLDLSGTEKLFQRSRSDKKLTRQNGHDPWSAAILTITTAAAKAGFQARVALAANPDTAFLAARGFSENKIIPAGEEAHTLALLSIDVLPISPEIRETLRSWGIRNFESLAALPEVAIVERLGQEGLYLQKLARGEITRPLLPFEPNAEFIARYEFDDPVETLESIFFILNRLLDDLCTRLLSTAQAASELRLTVGLNVRQQFPENFHDRGRATLQGRAKPVKSVGALAPVLAPNADSLRRRSHNSDTRSDISSAGVTLRILPSEDDCDTHDSNSIHADRSEHVWKLPAPTQDKNLLFNLIRLHLENSTFSAPIRELCLEVIPVKPRLAQGNLFLPPAPEPEKLELTLERIRGVVGTTDAEGVSCVGSPSLVDTHKPGSFTLQNFSSIEETALSKFENSRIRAQQMRPISPLKCHPEPSEGPMHFASRVSQPAPTTALRIFRPALETTVVLDGKKPHSVRLWSRRRRILAASGPWSSSGNWWSAAAWTREEWDIAIQTPAGLGFYRIYRDRLRRQWFVEGVFD